MRSGRLAAIAGAVAIVGMGALTAACGSGGNNNPATTTTTTTSTTTTTMTTTPPPPAPPAPPTEPSPTEHGTNPVGPGNLFTPGNGPSPNPGRIG
jgi:ABC-type glycerol-3-phosphate transport system substrate-binding protein